MDLGGVTLPDELTWQNEFDWSPKTHSTSYGITGSLFIQTGDKQAGRDITLVGGESLGWVTRTTVESLQTLRDNDTEMTLTLPDARTFTVRFKQNETPIEVEPVVSVDQYTSTTYYKVKALKLFQVPDP